MWTKHEQYITSRSGSYTQYSILVRPHAYHYKTGFSIQCIGTVSIECNQSHKLMQTTTIHEFGTTHLNHGNLV